jgi:hypothetical protein
MPWNTLIPEACDRIAGEYAAEEKPCPIGYDDSQEDVAAVASSRVVEKAEVEEEDGDFGERQALAISHYGNVERLNGISSQEAFGKATRAYDEIIVTWSREVECAMTQGIFCFYQFSTPSQMFWF